MQHEIQKSRGPSISGRFSITNAALRRGSLQNAALPNLFSSSLGRSKALGCLGLWFEHCLKLVASRYQCRAEASSNKLCSQVAEGIAEAPGTGKNTVDMHNSTGNGTFVWMADGARKSALKVREACVVMAWCLRSAGVWSSCCLLLPATFLCGVYIEHLCVAPSHPVSFLAF